MEQLCTSGSKTTQPLDISARVLCKNIDFNLLSPTTFKSNLYSQLGYTIWVVVAVFGVWCELTGRILYVTPAIEYLYKLTVVL